MKESVEPSLSLASIHCQPLGSKSHSWSAACSESARLRSDTKRCRPLCDGYCRRYQSICESWFHSRPWPNSSPMKSSFLPGVANINAKSRRRSEEHTSELQSRVDLVC